jgi:hypothetical protein
MKAICPRHKNAKSGQPEPCNLWRPARLSLQPLGMKLGSLGKQVGGKLADQPSHSGVSGFVLRRRSWALWRSVLRGAVEATMVGAGQFQAAQPNNAGADAKRTDKLATHWGALGIGMSTTSRRRCPPRRRICLHRDRVGRSAMKGRPLAVDRGYRGIGFVPSGLGTNSRAAAGIEVGIQAMVEVLK